MTPDFVSAVETRFRDFMSVEYAGVPLFYENMAVTDDVETFAMISVLNSDLTLPINVGGKAFSRNPGVIQIDVFCPKDTGAGDAKRMAYAAGKLFRRLKLNVTDEGVATFKDPTVKSWGTTRGWHREIVSLPYRYDFDGV
jgi:hypothetical protein